MPAAPACVLLKNKEKSPSLVGNVTAAEVFEADDTSVQKTVYTHDELNRVATRKTLLKDQNGNYTSNGPTWSYTYYNEGYVKTETDPNTLTTQFFYDGEWRLTRVLNAAGDERENIYDQAGNLTHAVDENGKRCAVGNTTKPTT
jgi:YD repeat-containing protein